MLSYWVQIEFEPIAGFDLSEPSDGLLLFQGEPIPMPSVWNEETLLEPVDFIPGAVLYPETFGDQSIVLTWAIEDFYLASEGEPEILVSSSISESIPIGGPDVVTVSGAEYVWVFIDGSENNPPVAVDDSLSGFTTDKYTEFTTASVLALDYDPDGDEIQFVDFDATGLKGELVHLGDGIFSYDPNDQFDYLGVNQIAFDEFTYRITDGTDFDTAKVTISITGISCEEKLELLDAEISRLTSVYDEVVKLEARAQEVGEVIEDWEGILSSTQNSRWIDILPRWFGVFGSALEASLTGEFEDLYITLRDGSIELTDAIAAANPKEIGPALGNFIKVVNKAATALNFAARQDKIDEYEDIIENMEDYQDTLEQEAFDKLWDEGFETSSGLQEGYLELVGELQVLRENCSADDIVPNFTHVDHFEIA